MMRLLFPICATLLVAACASSRVDAQKQAKSCYHRNADVETEIGYCEALRSGNTLHVSGSVGQGDMPAAMRHAYETIRQTLAANGFSFRDVVKENVYATDLDAFIGNKELRKEYYGSELPAATWVQVQRLYLPAFVVEIEVTAQH